jgi:hypothetical protein
LNSLFVYSVIKIKKDLYTQYDYLIHNRVYKVQYAPILFDHIETIINETRLKNGDANRMYILIEIIGREEIPIKVNIDILLDRAIHKIIPKELFINITRGFLS